MILKAFFLSSGLLSIPLLVGMARFDIWLVWTPLGTIEVSKGEPGSRGVTRAHFMRWCNVNGYNYETQLSSLSYDDYRRYVAWLYANGLRAARYKSKKKPAAQSSSGASLDVQSDVLRRGPAH